MWLLMLCPPATPCAACCTTTTGSWPTRFRFSTGPSCMVRCAAARIARPTQPVTRGCRAGVHQDHGAAQPRGLHQRRAGQPLCQRQPAAGGWALCVLHSLPSGCSVFSVFLFLIRVLVSLCIALSLSVVCPFLAAPQVADARRGLPDIGVCGALPGHVCVHLRGRGPAARVSRAGVGRESCLGTVHAAAFSAVCASSACHLLRWGASRMQCAGSTHTL